MMAVVDHAMRAWLADFKAANPSMADNKAIWDTARYAFRAGQEAERSRPRHRVSATTQKLIDMLIERDQMGRAKYGMTLDRTDLTLDQWLQHQVEELLDGAGYALAAMRTNQEQGK